VVIEATKDYGPLSVVVEVRRVREPDVGSD